MYVISGATFGILIHWSSVAVGNLGWSVCGLDDVNGDGVGDYAMGAPFATSSGSPWTGRVSVISGADHSYIAQIHGPAGSRFGFSIDGLQDLDGDSRPEIVVGAPFADVHVTDNGAAYVYSILPKTQLFVRFGANSGERFGQAVANAGDVDGDGIDDIAFGAPFADAGGTDSGRVLVTAGAWPHLQIDQIVGQAGELLGWAVAGGGDVDGDGLDDVVVGVPYAGLLQKPKCGAVRVYSGASGQVLHSLVGSSAGDELGRAVASLGDVNGDGRADLLGGAPFADPVGSSSGSARAWIMSTEFPQRYCQAKTNSAGCKPYLSHTGVPSVSVANNFTVRANNVLNNKLGMLIWARQPANIPFGGGTLCVASPAERTYPTMSGGSPSGWDCTGSYEFLFSHAILANEGLTAGDVVYVQFWSRDPGFPYPQSMGLTDALAVTLIP